MASPKPTRVIIVGAGWYGLAAGKTYLSLCPSISLTILDADSTVGGVWSASRIYPGLVADSPAANFDYSDLPMDEELGIDKWADLPAEKVHEYLERYVDKFDLRRRCRLNTRVLSVEREERGEGESIGWKVDVEEDCGVEGKKKESLVCDKLIIASGVNSTRNLPEGLNWADFLGPIMHSKEVGTKYSRLTSEAVQKVAVVGGNKSAVDVAMLCARAGKEVDWIISPDGYGPGILLEPRTQSGTSVVWLKLARASTLLGPTVLNASGFWYWFLHSGKSRIGAWLLKWIMLMVTKEALEPYSRNENTMKIAPDLPE
jgi:dimethylaniline monooxygenase (N-oxide forming)